MYVTAADMEAIAQRYGNACFVTGMKVNGQRRADHEKGLKNCPPPSLTLVRADPALPFSVDNAAPCTRVTARLLNYTLPPHLLAEWRARKGATPHAELAAEQPAAAESEPQQQRQEPAVPLPTAPAEQPPGAEPEQQEPAAPQPTTPLAMAKEQLPASEPAAAVEQPPAALPLDKQPERAVLQHSTLAAGAKEQELASRAARWAELRRGLLTKGESPGLKRKREAEAAPA